MSIWGSGEAYERYVGRWSRLVAHEFLGWLEVPPGGRWVDVGCGTGALTTTILSLADPASVSGVDSSEGFVAHARQSVQDPRAEFYSGDARDLPFEDATFDVAVSGLVLNFVPRPEQGLAELVRVTRGGGTVAVYVWDYAGEMQLMRRFWDAAAAEDPAAAGLDEGLRSPICSPVALEQLFRNAGLEDVAVRAIDMPTTFRDFEDYWSPFLGGQGSAPSYAVSLAEDRRTALGERLRATLPTEKDGSIHLIARAWAARGRVAQRSAA